MRRVGFLLLVAAVLVAGCSGDGLIAGSPHAGGIVITTKPGTDMRAFTDDDIATDEDAESTGAVGAVTTDGQVVVAFGDNASAAEMGAMSLRLLREDRVADFFVSVLDERGEGVVRP